MEKLRIFILNASPIYGGGEYYTYQLALNLVKRGHYVIIGCRKDNLLINKCANTGIQTEKINFGNKGFFGLINEIKLIAKNNKINIIHTNTVEDRTTGAVAAKLTGAKHVTSCHSLLSVQRNITHYIRNKKLTNAFIADGISVKELLVNKDKINPHRIHVINNGIVPEEMKRNAEKRKSLRDEFGIKDDDIIIGCTARLVYFKGHKYLLNAFEILFDKNKSAKLMIVGDGELMNELIEYSRILKISDRIIFTGFRDDLQNLYSAFDIYAHPSVSGGGELFPYSVLYAMAQGLPVAATSIGDMPYMVKDHRSGFIVKERSAVELSDKLDLLINDRALREKFGKEAYSRFINNFTIEQTIDKTEKLYYDILVGLFPRKRESISGNI